MRKISKELDELLPLAFFIIAVYLQFKGLILNAIFCILIAIYLRISNMIYRRNE
jgi:hypothetical protein